MSASKRRIGRPNVADRRRRGRALAALACAALAAAGCASNHRVSPWGEAAGPPLGAYVERPNLEARLAEIDAETRGLGLELTGEFRGKLAGPGGPVVVRAYRGADALGRPETAVRAATSRGVVLAIGPLDPLRRTPGEASATELVVDLAPATDLNGDGAPEVVLRGERGGLEVWRLDVTGSTRLDVELAVVPTRAVDVNGDGRADLAGDAAVAAGDPIAPRLDDAATFDGVRYSNRTPEARAWHAMRAAELLAAPEAPEPDAARLRRAIERAWHRLLAGEPRRGVLAALDAEPVPAALREAVRLHRARLDRIAVAPASR